MALRLTLGEGGEDDYTRHCDYCNRGEGEPDDRTNFYDFWHRSSEQYLDFCSLFCLYKWLESQIRVGVVK